MADPKYIHLLGLPETHNLQELSGLITDAQHSDKTTIPDAHHSRYTDGEVGALILIHAALPMVHHIKTINAAEITAGVFAEDRIPHTFSSLMTFNAGIRLADGQKIEWSDVNLYRSAAGVLRTDENLDVGGYGYFTNGVFPVSDRYTKFTNTTLANAVSEDFLLDMAANLTVTVGRDIANADVNINSKGSGRVKFPATGIVVGDDTNLYRSAANILKTDDNFDALSLRILGTIVLTSTRVLQNVTSNASIITAGTFNENRIPHTFASLMTFNAGIRLADGQKIEWSDVNLYRVSPNLLKTDDNLNVAGALQIGADCILERESANMFFTADSFKIQGTNSFLYVGLGGEAGYVQIGAGYVIPTVSGGYVGTATNYWAAGYASAAIGWVTVVGVECWDDRDDLNIINNLKKERMEDGKFHYPCNSFPQPIFVPPSKEEKNKGSCGAVSHIKLIGLLLGAVRALDKKAENLKAEIKMLKGGD